MISRLFALELSIHSYSAVTETAEPFEDLGCSVFIAGRKLGHSSPIDCASVKMPSSTEVVFREAFVLKSSVLKFEYGI